MGTSRHVALPPAIAATRFAMDCEANVERFDGGLNGRAAGAIHDMELTEIVGGLYRIYLPACHTSTFGMEPLAFEATSEAVDCRSCQRQAPGGRAAPRHPPVHSRDWRSRQQLAMAYPDDPTRRTGLWIV